MNNKFLDKYPQLREPQIGDIVESVFSMSFYVNDVPVACKIKSPYTGKIQDFSYDTLNQKYYHIIVDNFIYYRYRDDFVVVKYVE
jgi:hypothetical protein